MQKKKGVSLIVLSITILVMVILASATIITLENSGIIGRSKTAVTKQQLKEEMTRLTVIKNGVLTDNLGTITVAEYIAELDKKGIIDGTTSTDEYGSTVVKTTSGADVYIRQNGESDLTISFEQIIPPTLGNLVKSSDYGAKINYVSDNGVTDWKVFYEDEKNGYVYLIASEQLEKDKIPTILGETEANGGAKAVIKGISVALGDAGTRTVGQICWSLGGEPTKVATIQNPERWMANWSDYNTNRNGIFAAYFLDETYWTVFKNTSASYKDYVLGAIGTPTAEMFVASWNAKRETETNTDKKN